MLGFWETNRLDLGVNVGWFLGEYGGGFGFEALGFYEWKFDITDNGLLSWYAGPGIALGYMGMAWKGEYEDSDVSYRPWVSGVGLSAAVGANAGIEINFAGFIDKEHTLRKYKDLALSLDLRPMIYIPGLIEHDDDYSYLYGGVKKSRSPLFVSFTVGISSRYTF